MKTIFDSSIGSRGLFILSITVLFFISTFTLQAQNTCVATGGVWGNASTWTGCGGTFPQDGDIVIIPDLITVEIPHPNGYYPANGDPNLGPVAPKLFIYVGGYPDDGDTDGAILQVSGHLNLIEGSALVIYEHSETDDTGPGSNEKMFIYNEANGTTPIQTLSGAQVAIPGPATFDEQGVITGPPFDPLPVELTFLKSSASNGRIILQWQTASELNNDYFDVERSEDGSTFYAIGRVKGNGTTDLVQNYQFTDKSPIATVEYYRLKQVDFDGAFEYSKVIVGYSDEIASQVRMTTYPNPAVERVSFKSTSPLTFAKLHLINLAGQVVADLSDKVTGYGLAYDVELPALDKGLYYLQYQTTTGQAGAHKLLIK